jgi:DNA-binding GntR family transcriptional regulator
VATTGPPSGEGQTRDAGRTAPRARRGGAPIGDEVYEELLSRMLSSRIAAGERLTIDALCRELNVSQTPIREAMHRLSGDGLVVRHHLSGYRVAPTLTREQFEDLVDIRLLLEPAAARRAAESMKPDQLAGLREVAERLGEAPQKTDAALAYAVFSRLDGQFHDKVAEGSQNRYIRDALARLHTHVQLFRLSSHPQITSGALEEHAMVVGAIARRDPDEAAYAMRVHIEESARRFRRSFEPGTFPQPPSPSGPP